MYRAFCLLFALTIAPALGACCNFDKDTLEQEAATIPGILDAIAGKFERMPRAYYRNELAVTEGVNSIEERRRRIEALDQLGFWDEAAKLLDGAVIGTSAEHKARYARIYFHRCMLGVIDQETIGAAELMARETGAADLQRIIITWAAERRPVKADEMLPDYFGLRFASNKTAIADNDQLDTLKLRGVIDFLLSLLKANPAWENVDTYYALSLALAVDGKQQLAQFARLRVRDLLTEGHTTRLPLAEGVTDIEPLLYARQLQLGRLVEIRTLDEPQKKHCAEEYAHRRAFAKLWLAEREAFISKRLEAGRTPTEPDFWQGFIPPVMAVRQVEQPPANAAPGPTPVVEAANVPAPEPAQTRAVSSGAVAGAAAAAAMVLVITAAARRRRNRKTE